MIFSSGTPSCYILKKSIITILLIHIFKNFGNQQSIIISPSDFSEGKNKIFKSHSLSIANFLKGFNFCSSLTYPRDSPSNIVYKLWSNLNLSV